MDALADILRTVQLKANTYYCNEFASPWGIETDALNKGLFHIVNNGSCYIKTDPNNEADYIRLDTGDIVAFPTGGYHAICDMPATPKMPASKVLEYMEQNQAPFSCCGAANENVTSIICGSFTFEHTISHPFIRDLPKFIHIKASETPELEWLRNLMKVLACESKNPSPGSTIMIDKLTEVLFIQLIRAYIKNAPCGMCYLNALADSQIGQALNLIHADEQSTHSVETLGKAVAMSRTAFTDKFTQLIGMPPKTYLLNWRMQKAKNLLQVSNESMFSIATNSGYSSEAAFSKAFKQFFGTPPGKVRKQAVLSA